MIFNFFFDATAGITLGLVVVILPALYLINRFMPKRGGRS